MVWIKGLRLNVGVQIDTNGCCLDGGIVEVDVFFVPPFPFLPMIIYLELDIKIEDETSLYRFN